MNTDRYVTVQQAATMLGVSIHAVYCAIYAQRIPHSVAFGCKIIDREDLETYRKRSQPFGEKRVGRPPKLHTI